MGYKSFEELHTAFTIFVVALAGSLFNVYYICMQSSVDVILEQLESLIQITKQLEEKYTAQVLTLQKIINYSFKSLPVFQRQSTKKNQEKSIAIQISVDSKIDALLNEFQIQKRNLQNEQKPKIQIKQAEIVVQKKPPLPTINRNEKNIKNMTPAFIAPKSRDGLTGKVTQTTIKTTDQKVFRPQLNAMKRSDSRLQKRPKNVSKSKVPEAKTQKRQQVKELTKAIARKQQIREQKREEVMQKYIQEVPKQDKKPESTKQAVSKMASFNKELDTLMEQLLRRDQKNHKKQLSKMISELENQQKGHKMHEETNRNTFVKHVYNYTASRNNVNSNYSHSISRKRWKYHSQIFQLNDLISKLQNQVQNVALNEDCRLDPKQQYRIIQSATKYSSIVNQIVEQSQSHIPDQLDLTFAFNSLQKSSNNEQQDHFSFGERKLTESFMQLLTQISESGTLQKPQLRALQILAEVTLFNSRRCPLLVMRTEYQNWKENYTNNNYENLNYNNSFQP